MPDSDIVRSGIFTKQILSEYSRISGSIPDFCDCKLVGYINYLRNYYGSIS